MALNPIDPKLRTIHHDAVSAAKVTVVVQPGAELTVPDDVADQLTKSSPQFKDKAAPAKKAPAKKAPAKKAAAKKGD